VFTSHRSVQGPLVSLWASIGDEETVVGTRDMYLHGKLVWQGVYRAGLLRAVVTYKEFIDQNGTVRFPTEEQGREVVLIVPSAENMENWAIQSCDVLADGGKKIRRILKATSLKVPHF